MTVREITFYLFIKVFIFRLFNDNY